MKRLFALAAAACAFATLAASQIASADTPSVTSTWSATPATSCAGSTTVTVNVGATDPPAVQRPVDVAFVIDESGSILNSDFATVKQSIADWAAQQVFGSSAIGATVIEFGSNARLAIPYTLNQQSFVNQVQTMVKANGSTDMTDGLQLAQQELVTNGRPGVPRVLILETDGQPNVNVAQLPTVAAGIRSTGTTIFTVGVGADVVESQLAAIASTPVQTHVFLSGDYSGLDAAFRSIETEINPAATNASYTATAAPGWTIDSATGDGVTLVGGHVQWSQPVLHTGSITITYTLRHTGATGGDVAPQATADLTWTDPSGQAQHVSYADRTVQVGGCNQPPTANAGPDQTVDLSGSPQAAVTLDGTGSTDDGQIQPLTYTWSENGSTVATGPNPTVQLGLGTHDLTLTVDDGQFQSTDDVRVTVVDPTPPTITPVVTGTLGDNGWYTSDVSVAWTVVDPESTPTTCPTTDVTSDTAGQVVTCTASSAGGQATSSVTIPRDATAPTVSWSGNAGAYGVADSVDITCSATDAGSGVASDTCRSITGPAYLYVGSSSFTATATDNAGNTGSATTSFNVVVHAADICSLVDQWVGQHGIANSLCVKLAHGSTGAFVNEVNAQRGKTLSSSHADVLIALAKQL